MSTMPGNRFNDELRAWHNLGNDTTPAEIATLALAFEQRTIALIEYAKVADAETADRLWVDHIAPRLGLDETNE